MKLKRLLLTIIVVIITFCTIKFQYDIVYKEKKISYSEDNYYKLEEYINNEVEKLK